eukprot:357678-Chlamydomonas_euryale.AAC.10
MQDAVESPTPDAAHQSQPSPSCFVCAPSHGGIWGRARKKKINDCALSCEHARNQKECVKHACTHAPACKHLVCERAQQRHPCAQRPVTGVVYVVPHLGGMMHPNPATPWEA